MCGVCVGGLVYRLVGRTVWLSRHTLAGFVRKAINEVRKWGVCVGGLVYRLVERTVCLNSAASPLKKDETGSLASSRNRSLGIIRDVVLGRLENIYTDRAAAT